MALADKAGRSGLVAPMLTRDIIDDGQVHLVFAGESAVAEVEVGTLDGHVDSQRLPHVDLLKIDVEGAEQAVLLGASKTLSTFRPTLICEIQDLWAGRYGTTAQRSFDLLTQLYGYRPHAFIDGRLVPVGRPVEGLINYVFLQPPDVSRN